MKVVESEEERTNVSAVVSRETWKSPPKFISATCGLLKPCKLSQNAVAGKYESADCACRALEARKTLKAAAH